MALFSISFVNFSEKAKYTTKYRLYIDQYVRYLVNAVVKESEACVFIADKRALLDETDEHLSLCHEGVKLLMGSVTTLQKACE